MLPLRPKTILAAACAAILTATILFVAWIPEPLAADKRPLPRFVSLRFETVNVRAGPGRKYPIRWVYKRRGLPVEIVREVFNWRLVRDVRGDRGWIHVSNLTSRRGGLIRRKRQALRAEPKKGARVVAVLTAHVIVQLRRCDGAWCTVRIGRYRGWLPRTAIWGVYPTETFE